MKLFELSVNHKLMIRRLTIVVNQVIDEEKAAAVTPAEQLDIFTDYENLSQQRKNEQIALDKERRMQEAPDTLCQFQHRSKKV